MLPLALLGCATNLAVLQPSKPLKPGQVRVGGQAGIHAPIGTLVRATVAGVDLVDATADVAANGGELPEPVVRDALTAGLAVALAPPGAELGLDGRVGLPADFDVGGRISSSGWRLDAKRALIEGDATTSLLVGVERYRFTGLLVDAVDVAEKVSKFVPGLEVDVPTRWDLDAVLLTGAPAGDHVRLHGGLRYRVALYELPTVLSADLGQGTEVVADEDIKGRIHLPGGNAGIAVGARGVWLTGEINASWAVFRTEVLGEPVNTGGLVLYPAIGLAWESRGKR